MSSAPPPHDSDLPDPTWRETCGAASPEDLVPPLPAGASEAARRDPLFDWYGNLGRQSPQWLMNRWVPLPLHIYDGDLTMIVGQAPLRKGLANQVTVGRSHNEDVGCIVLIWIGHYTDTSIGPYDSIWASVVTAKDDGSPEPRWLENPLGPGKPNGHGSGHRPEAEPPFFDAIHGNVRDNPFLLALPVLQPDRYRFTSVFWRVSHRLPQRVLTDVFAIDGVDLGTINIDIKQSGNARFLQFLCTDRTTGAVLAQGRVRHEDDDREVAYQFAPVSQLLGWHHTRDLIVQNVQQRPTRGTLVDHAGNPRAVLHANFWPFLRLWEWHPISGDQVRLAVPNLDLNFTPVLYFRARGFKGVLAHPVDDALLDGEGADDEAKAARSAASFAHAHPSGDEPDALNFEREELLATIAARPALVGEPAASGKGGGGLANGDNGAPNGKTPAKKKGPRT